MKPPAKKPAVANGTSKPKAVAKSKVKAVMDLDDSDEDGMSDVTMCARLLITRKASL